MPIEIEKFNDVIESARTGIKSAFLKEGKNVTDQMTNEILTSYFEVETLEDVKDVIEGGDPDQFNLEDRVRNVSAKIASYNILPLNTNVDDKVVELLDVELTPHCHNCGCAQSHTIAVISQKKYTDQAWICPDCLDDEDATAVRCRLCDNEVAYAIDEVDHNGLCSDHKGEEEDEDEDETADRESYVEYQLEHQD